MNQQARRAHPLPLVGVVALFVCFVGTGPAQGQDTARWLNQQLSRLAREHLDIMVERDRFNEVRSIRVEYSERLPHLLSTTKAFLTRRLPATTAEVGITVMGDQGIPVEVLIGMDELDQFGFDGNKGKGLNLDRRDVRDPTVYIVVGSSGANGRGSDGLQGSGNGGGAGNIFLSMPGLSSLLVFPGNGGDGGPGTNKKKRRLNAVHGGDGGETNPDAPAYVQVSLPVSDAPFAPLFPTDIHVESSAIGKTARPDRTTPIFGSGGLGGNGASTPEAEFGSYAGNGGSGGSGVSVILRIDPREPRDDRSRAACTGSVTSGCGGQGGNGGNRDSETVVAPGGNAGDGGDAGDILIDRVFIPNASAGSGGSPGEPGRRVSGAFGDSGERGMDGEITDIP